jgi:hypothetical protein
MLQTCFRETGPISSPIARIVPGHSPGRSTDSENPTDDADYRVVITDRHEQAPRHGDPIAEIAAEFFIRS